MGEFESSRHRRLPPLSALRAFEAAARHLSFQRAAEELVVTPTAISHQIRHLEATLGLALFHRHVRRVSLTEAGLRLYPVLREGFEAFARAIAALSQPSHPEIVTLTATTLFTARRIIPALGYFRLRHPHVDLRLHASDDVVDLKAGFADIAVRYGNGPFEGLRAIPLMTERFGVVCSPGLGIGAFKDLKRATLIHTEWKRRGKAPNWRRWAKLAGVSGLAVDQGPRFTDDGHALQAAVAGHGVAIASLVLAAPEMEAGLLRQPFGPVIEGETYHIVEPRKARPSPVVRAVRDWLKDAIL